MAQLTAAERQDMLALYEQAYDRLTAVLEGIPSSGWQHRSAPDAWTIHEIVIHIADAEVNSFFRIRRAIAEPGSAVPAYDQTAWATRLDYHNQLPEDALELFRLLRKQSVRLLKKLPVETWSNTVEHSVNGTMTLDDLLVTYTSHAEDHIRQCAEQTKSP